MLVAYLEQIKGKESVKADGSLQLTKADIAFMLDFYKRLIDEDVLMPIDSFDRNAFRQERQRERLRGSVMQQIIVHHWKRTVRRLL